ncbi:MAG: hypothetical protein V1754_05130, partial [Pseudomonadota bacterium]
DLVGESIPVNPIYFFYDENGKPLFRLSDNGTRLVGWHPIIGKIPTQSGYSPFWRVHRVRIVGKADHTAIDSLAKLPTPQETCQMDAVCPKGQRCVEERCRAPIKIGLFKLDGIKSLNTLKNSKLIISETDRVINCPIVDADAKLLKGISDPDKPFPKIQLWFERLKTFCLLMEGAKPLLGSGSRGLPTNGAPPIHNAFFVRQKLTFGTNETQYVLPTRHMVLTEYLPDSPDYSPLVREVSVLVDKDHNFRDIRSFDEAKAKAASFISTNNIHNLVVRGTIPACTTDDDCANTGGKVDPPLKCSVETGYCSPPFARFGEECRRGVIECDPKGGPNGTPLICIGLRSREKYFCFNACDSSEKDQNPDPNIDSRCGSIDKTTCYPMRQTDPTRPNGLCIKSCNSRAGGKQELVNECVSPTCGDGNLDFFETCDDGNQTNQDGCNEYCSLSTFVRCDWDSDCKDAGQKCQESVFGQKNTYCLPSAANEKDETEDKNKYRTICMEYDWCWPPDERADWLGIKEEQQ